MPFVMVNVPHSLDALRSMGFKSYHPYIDETYDTIENDQDRMISVMHTLLKLRDNPPDRATVEKINDIAYYNRNLLLCNPKGFRSITDNQGVEIFKVDKS